MAPTHSKPIENRPFKRLRSPLAECAMNKIARGAAVFSDDFVDAMAEGKDVKLPKNLDDIVVPVANDGDDKKAGKKVIKCSYDELEEMHQDNKLCPKHEKRDPFALWGDATYYSDGELNHFNVTCQGTDSSPCFSCCSNLKTPEPSPEKPPRFAQAN